MFARVWWHLSLLGLALVSVTGCGADSCTPGASTEVVVFSVPSLEEQGNYWGITHWGCKGEPTVIEISRETPFELLGRVVAHELLHAAGLVDHEAGADCYLHTTVFPGQSVVPCSNEVDRLAEVLQTYTVRVRSAPLLRHVEGAANMWNDYADRDVFIVVDESDPDHVAEFPVEVVPTGASSAQGA